MKPGAETFRLAEQGARLVSDAFADELSIENIARMLGRPVPKPYSPPLISRGIPALEDGKFLGEGIHITSWPELMERFATNPVRAELAKGMLGASHDLKDHGYTEQYLGGSFPTDKEFPVDYDLAFQTGRRGALPLYAKLPLLRDEEVTRYAYGGDVLPDFAQYFQYNNRIGRRVGILKIDTDTLPPRDPNVSMGISFMDKFGGTELFRRVLRNSTTEQPFPSIDGRFSPRTVSKQSTDRVNELIERIKASKSQ